MIYSVINLDAGSTLAASVSVAGSSELRRKGLLGVLSLADDSGLWIAPCEAIHTFGMQMAIDVIYLDREHRIKKLLSALPPKRLSVCLSAYSVLELSTGAIARSRSKIGDRLRLQPLPVH